MYRPGIEKKQQQKNRRVEHHSVKSKQNDSASLHFSDITKTGISNKDTVRVIHCEYCLGKHKS